MGLAYVEGVTHDYVPDSQGATIYINEQSVTQSVRSGLTARNLSRQLTLAKFPSVAYLGDRAGIRGGLKQAIKQLETAVDLAQFESLIGIERSGNVRGCYQPQSLHFSRTPQT
jgi:hypothetical protein